jgi:hypothetical protein
MARGSTPDRCDTTTVLESQLYRFRKALLNKGEGVDEVAFPGAIRSDENRKRAEIDRNLRDTFVISDLHLLDAGNHKRNIST